MLPRILWECCWPISTDSMAIHSDLIGSAYVARKTRYHGGDSSRESHGWNLFVNYVNYVNYVSYVNYVNWLVVFRHPSEKYEWKSVGMMIPQPNINIYIYTWEKAKSMATSYHQPVSTNVNIYLGTLSWMFLIISVFKKIFNLWGFPWSWGTQ